jgi:hypothetical protein
MTLALEPLFINLTATPPSRLESAGGFFGWVLRLVQQRTAKPAEFQRLLQTTVQHLEAIPAPPRLRWLELLSYVHALVYNTRHQSEHERLQEMIESSARTEEKQEVRRMEKTIAEALRDEGRREGELRARRHTLLSLLRERFKNVPDETAAVIEATKSVRQLDRWVVRVLSAARLEDMGIERTP